MTPPSVVTGELPSAMPSVEKVTDPLGSEPDDGVTVAVSRTACP